MIRTSFRLEIISLSDSTDARMSNGMDCRYDLRKYFIWISEEAVVDVGLRLTMWRESTDFTGALQAGAVSVWGPSPFAATGVGHLSLTQACEKCSDGPAPWAAGARQGALSRTLTRPLPPFSGGSCEQMFYQFDSLTEWPTSDSAPPSPSQELELAWDYAPSSKRTVILGNIVILTRAAAGDAFRIYTEESINKEPSRCT